MWIGWRSIGRPKNSGTRATPAIGTWTATMKPSALRRLSEDPPALGDGGDQVAEVVAGQDDRGGLAGDVGAALAHGHADRARRAGPGRR
jgi:hypothetical protein